MAGTFNSGAAPVNSSLRRLQSLNGLFAIHKKQGPTSADVLNTLKETLLKGNSTRITFYTNVICRSFQSSVSYFAEAGVQNPNPRKRKKQSLKMGHGGTLDSAASGVLGKSLHPAAGLPVMDIIR